jgi:hypothetical protein
MATAACRESALNGASWAQGDNMLGEVPHVRPPRARVMTPPQAGALEALSRAGAYLCYTLHDAVVLDKQGHRTRVKTNTARSLIRYGWTAVCRRNMLISRDCFEITDAGRSALVKAKARGGR